MQKRHTNIPAVYLLLQKNNQILLLQRKSTGYMDGFYSLVAGHVDAGEDAKTAMLREAKEEVGIDIQLQDLRFIHVMHRKSIDSERIDFFFSTHTWEREIKNIEPDKCSDLSWFNKNNLPRNTIPYIKYFLNVIKQGKKYSQYGWNKPE